nr:hypothetical protein Iba_chr12dCG4500 [Ipomoea batatas]
MSRSEKSWKRLPEYPAVEKTTAGTLWFLVQAGYITQKHTSETSPKIGKARKSSPNNLYQPINRARLSTQIYDYLLYFAVEPRVFLKPFFQICLGKSNLLLSGYLAVLPPPPLPILSEIFLYIYKPRNKPDNFGGRETVII